MKRIPLFLGILTAGFLIFHFLFFWMNGIVDSSFYYAIGKYFQTGHYPFSYPFIYSRPTTISPPLYGLMLVTLEYLPRPDVVLHFLQLVMLVGVGFFTYKILRMLTSKWVAVVVGCVTILIPANIVYASYMMTEIGAEFLVAVIVYLMVKGIKEDSKCLAYAIFLSSVAVVWKYAFILYGLIGFFLLIYTKAKRTFVWILPILGVLVVSCWLYVNFTITGIIGLSDANGVHLWNEVVWYGRILPGESAPAMQKFRQYVPANVDVYKGYWDLQGYILPKEGNSWAKVDEILGNVAREAIREQPFAYIRSSINGIWTIHSGGLPYWENTGSFGKKFAYPYPPECAGIGKYAFCEPVVRISNPYTLWNSYVSLTDWFYIYLYPIISAGILLPLVLFLLLKGGKGGKTSRNSLYFRSAFKCDVRKSQQEISHPVLSDCSGYHCCGFIPDRFELDSAFAYKRAYRGILSRSLNLDDPFVLPFQIVGISVIFAPFPYA